MSKSKILYPELVRNLRIAERKLSRTLLLLPSNVSVSVAVCVALALHDVRKSLISLDHEASL